MEGGGRAGDGVPFSVCACDDPGDGGHRPELGCRLEKMTKIDQYEIIIIRLLVVFLSVHKLLPAYGQEGLYICSGFQLLYLGKSSLIFSTYIT